MQLIKTKIRLPQVYVALYYFGFPNYAILFAFSILASLFRPFCLLSPKDFKFIWFSNF